MVWRAVVCFALLAGGGCRQPDEYDALFGRLTEARMQPDASSFTLLAGVAPGLRASSPSRLTFHVNVRPHTYLRVGTRLDASETPSARATASIGVSDGLTFRQLMTTDVGPESVSRERFVDLRAYEGLTVALIFNVRGDLPSRTALVWEAPTLVQR